MDISGIKRLVGIGGTKIYTDVKKNHESHTDRDADGRSRQNPRDQIKQLTPEQESEAILKLNAMPNFHKAGLKATIVREEGKAPYVVVKDSAHNIVRQLPYAHLIDLYLDRNNDAQSGRLLKRAA